MTPAEVNKLLEKPSLTPEELYRSGVLHTSRNGTYEIIARGDVESFRVGKKIVIPTAPLRRKLGMGD
jgi:hypothetical protein